MFLTPKWFRTSVGKLDDRQAHDFMVRVWSAAIFYFVIGFCGGFLVGMAV